MNYKVMNHEALKNEINEPIVTWGLSETTKQLFNEFNIQYIVENNKLLHNTYYKKAKIISIDELLNLNNKILLWGNHVYSHLLQLKDIGINNTIYINNSYTKENIFKITEKYFQNIEREEEQKNLFKNMVKMIEIEPHSFCNRTCWFCPNSYIDRRSETFFLDKTIIQKICLDLQSIDYDKMISFTRYSEPFGNEIFYETLEFIHKKLPRALLHANTNSDYLSNETLSKAYSAGLRSLNIQLYLAKNKEFNKNNVEELAEKILKRTSDLNVKLSIVEKDWIEFSCNYKDMNIRMYGRDFLINGSNRGSLVIKESIPRISPCLLPLTDIYIDYNGNIVPCCNIRSDDLSQKKYVIGNIKDHNSLFESYFCNNFLKWRKKLFNYKEKSFNPCVKCNFSVIEKTELLDNHITLLNKDFH